MSPTAHAYGSAPCYNLGEHMAPECVFVVAAALVGSRAVARALAREGCNLPWMDTMGARVYNCGDAVSQWHIVQDTDILVQAQSIEWDVAVTW